MNGIVFFVAHSGTAGRELWKTDGTTAGTVLVKDINSGSGSSDPSYFADVNGTVFFSAFNPNTGRELWKTNGTAAGTVLVKDIRVGKRSSDPAGMTNVNGTVLFSANDGNGGSELWKSNGTATWTVRVRDINSGLNGSSPSSLTNVNGTLFFTADDGSRGPELWKWTPAGGAALVKDIMSGPGGSYPYNLVKVQGSLLNPNGTLFFSAWVSELGTELWKSDGTELGTVLVKDIKQVEVCPYDCGDSSEPGDLTNVNGTVFFSATDGVVGRELWRSDGTELGTRLVADIFPGTRVYVHPFHGPDRKSVV